MGLKLSFPFTKVVTSVCLTAAAACVFDTLYTNKFDASPNLPQSPTHLNIAWYWSITGEPTDILSAGVDSQSTPDDQGS